MEQGDAGVDEQQIARLLDADADDVGDRLARLAASLTDGTLGVVWLLEDDHVVVRNVQGPEGSIAAPPALTGATVERAVRSIVATGEPLWLDDAVDGSPPVIVDGVRAWAGLPLRTSTGRVVGVLGALDARRRRWTARRREVLAVLALAATGEMAMRAGRAAADRDTGDPATGGGSRSAEAGVAVSYYRDRARSATAQAATSDQLAAEAQQLARLAEKHAAEVEEYAETLRESLLPTRLPQFPGVEVAARYRAGTGASVLGDFYDLIPTPAGWGAVVGDVCGKGPRAARTTALARSTVRAVGHTDEDPESVLSVLHGVLHVWFDQRPSFVTAVYASMAPRPDGDGLTMDIASAGHPPAVVQRRDGSVEALSAGGRALGIRPEPRIAVEPVTLHLGDRLLLFTDGITEARPVGGGEFETEGLVAALERIDPASDVDTTADAVLAAVDAHALGGNLDDTALLVIRAGPRPPVPSS